MIKQKITKLKLSIIIAIVLVIGGLAIGGLIINMWTELEVAGDPSDGVSISTSDKYYFGAYNSNPILWRTLSASGSEALLFSEDVLAKMPFRRLNVWGDSTIRTYLNSTETGGFIEGLPATIQTALVGTYITEAGITTTDKVYLLSKTEAETLDRSFLKLSTSWRLRTPSITSITSYYGVYVVNINGDFKVEKCFNQAGIRPALKLSAPAAIFKTGSGTLGNPYTIGDNGVTPTFASDTYVNFVVNGAAITWRVIAADGTNITLLPTTVIGSQRPFNNENATLNKWSESDIRTFLNPTESYDANTFSFGTAEAGMMMNTAITTKDDIPTTDKMFLLAEDEHGLLDRGNVNAAYWWLRSPGSPGVSAACVDDGDNVFSCGVGVLDDGGVRPAFKLNPSSVIFTSKIKIGADASKGETEADASYIVGERGAKNFKLTVVDTTLTARIEKEGGDTVAPVAVRATDATADTKLTYKIVNSSGQIVGYGQGTNTAVTVNTTSNVTDAGDIAKGSYTVYVWAQKNNATSSHTGSTPMCFTITVETVAP